MATRSDAPLSVWQVLEEELVALGGTLPSAFRQLKDEYVARRAAAEETCRQDPEGQSAACRRAVEARDLAEREYVRLLFELLHDVRRTALCFSGGGIRSATFGLGVLHGLAHASSDPGAARPQGLLSEFDYLSTVSGGGYLGGWFTAWRYWHPQGTRGVIDALAATPLDKLDPEPSALQHLRSYTAYLTPRSGLLSADTWTLVATVLRNILLNWTVLLPLVAAVLMVPRLTLAIARLEGSFVSWLPLTDDQVLAAVLGAGFALTVAPTAYVARALPSFGDHPGSQRQYFFGVLIPLSLAASLLTTYWAWYIKSGHAPYPVETFVKFGVAAHLMGAVIGAVLVLRPAVLSRAIFITAGLLITLATWRVVGYWPAVLAMPIASLALFRGYARVVGNAMLAAIATGGLGGALAYLLATRVLDPKTVDMKLYACLAFPSVLAIFGLVAMLLVAATSKYTREDDREWWARSGAWILIAVLAWLAFSAAVLYAPDLLRGLEASVAAAGGLSGIVASRLGFSGQTSSGRREDQPPRESASPEGSGRLRHIALTLAVPAFLVLLVLLVAIVDDRLLANLPSWLPVSLPPDLRTRLMQPVTRELCAMGLVVLPAVSLAFLININMFSLHGMYRSRLIRAYLGASNPRRRPNPFTGFDAHDNVRMRDVGRQKTAGSGDGSSEIERPLHVVNIALNLVKGEKLAWQQRKAESFTVTTLHAGSCRVGYRATRDYGDAEGMDLGTAITISGAAASPNQGYHSSPLVTILMALFNARLGWWLANPGQQGRGKWRLPGPRWAVTPWIHEAFGLTTDTAGWVYLSDGGHFDNLGLYEMVLRRCRLIVVVDASADPDYTLEDLGNAVRKIRVDFGIPIEFPRGIPIRSRLDQANAHCAIGQIQYRCVDGVKTRSGRKIKDGILIYLKPALNGNEPPDVGHYASVDKRFPQQPTVDQWFDEAQFESYRRLGSHLVDEMLGPQRPCSLAQFVRQALRHARAATARAS